MQEQKKINRVGVVAMPRIAVGGGFARATRDLIAALNSMGKEVYLTTPFHVDMNKIAELYGRVEIKKFFYPGKVARFFSRDDLLGRKLIVPTFKRMAKQVDFIIDLDGGVLHNHLPKEFDKNNYIIWRLSCINPETYKTQGVKDPKVLAKIIMKQTLKRMIRHKRDIPRGVRVYPLDEWTQREIIEFWHTPEEEMPFCLYPEIKVDEFEPKHKRKKQMAVLGRIAPNKSIHDSIEIFNEGTKGREDYNLIILGGVTPDSHLYIKQLNEQAEKLGLKNRVKILGDPSFKKIKDVLAESQILIDSQRGVSLTMTAIEAMASGCIVLAQKNGGTYLEVLENGKYGYGFNEVKDGGRQLYKLLEEIEKNNVTNKGAINRAEFFSSRSFINRLSRIFETQNG